MVATRAGGPGELVPKLAVMPVSSPNARVRGAVEMALRVVGPALDLAMLVSEGVSRLLERRDDGYGVVRMEHDGRAAPRAVPGYGRPSEAA